MKLTVFQSDKGDCLLLTGADGRRMLVDGGMRASYSEHVAPATGKLRDNGENIDVVYVSHIDQDHISGVLQMMDDEVAWRIHDFQVTNDNPNHKEPDSPRPPKVAQIWHNAFHDQIKDNAGEIEEMLAASAAILSGAGRESVRELASAQDELVTSIAEAIKLTKRVSPAQLGIKLNVPAKGKLMLVRPSTTAAIKLGGMRFSIIGPFSADLTKLRAEWNKWLTDNKPQLKSIQAAAKKDEASFGAAEIDDLLLPKLAQAEQMSALLTPDDLATAFKLGERENVTTPNLASLMFFVEENGKTLLLTGDGHHLDILKGLKHIKKLNGSGGIHVNVLKVQHHGSEHNLNEAFCRAVTADHYVFCGNGKHENPDLQVIEAIADSRISTGAKLSSNPQVGNPFKFSVNSSSTVTKNAEAKAHMKKVEKLFSNLANKSNGKMSFFFLKGSSFEVQI
ncbi:MAG: MBL fold metallo-hydrolase [Acidobacteriota bacterium]